MDKGRRGVPPEAASPVASRKKNTKIGLPFRTVRENISVVFSHSIWGSFL
jgi:hypothetical protein